MSSADTLKLLIGTALPKRSLFGEENFAGDEDIQIFYNSLVHEYKLDLGVYVSWACEPTIMLLRSKYGNVLVRSERLDTLMVEYIHVKAAFHNNAYSEEVRRHYIISTVLQWMTELLLGYHLPSQALAAWQLSREVSDYHLSPHSFRDESLASLPADLRVCLQCFSLAHEIGHILYPKKPNTTLDETVDGLPLMRHIERDLLESGFDTRQVAASMRLARENIDPAVLLSEIEADMFAFECVVRFIIQLYTISMHDAVKNTLFAFESLSFINSCKYSCGLLRKNMTDGELSLQDFLNGMQISVRARCVMRRAGFIWAILENPGKQLKAKDYNEYVPKVDALFLNSQSFLLQTNQEVVDHTRQLANEFRGLSKQQIAKKFKSQVKDLQKAPDQKYELWKLLIAYGCPGGTHVVSFFEGMFADNH